LEQYAFSINHNSSLTDILVLSFGLSSGNKKLNIPSLKTIIMKKFILATLITVTIGSSVLAADVSKVSFRVLNSFETQFAGATEVNWTVTADYTKVKFMLEGEKLEAFFNGNGDVIGTSRKTEFKRLPLTAIQKIKKAYSKYQVTETIEFELYGERKYYVSVENESDRKILEVSLYGEVTVFDKHK